MVPETYYTTETVKVPKIKTVMKKVMKPVIEYVPKSETYTDYVTDTISSQEAVDTHVTTKVNQPRAVMTKVKVKVPKEYIETFYELHAVTKTVDEVVQVPVTTVVQLPAPACHWHTMQHTHGITAGESHTHDGDNHDHGECPKDATCKETVKPAEPAEPASSGF